ncbi:protein of unknown function DUF4283 - like 10 [Theobroma cacao]|nr:protein of unknown function DUF4283 - like 10 [Theobroma cacao]
MQCFLSLYKEIFDTWFEVIRPYHEWTEEKKVCVWVKLEDVSLHLWQKSFFQAISNSWGRFVEMDKDIEEKGRLDFASILVEVTSKLKITSMNRVSVEGVNYWVRVFIIGTVGIINADSEANKSSMEKRKNGMPEQTAPSLADEEEADSGSVKAN